jgi:thiol-disulfide isomerase/thioredoxin
MTTPTETPAPKRPSGLPRTLLLGLLFMAALTYATFGPRIAAWLGWRPPPHELVGQAAPAFSAQTLDGKTLRFPEDFAGRIVLLDFWATWCPPCVAEIPHLREAQERFGERGLTIVGVSLDGPNGITAERVAQFMRDRRMDWPVIYTGASAIATQYDVSAIPAPFLIDADSRRILAVGPALLGPHLMRTLEEALAGR